MKKTFSILITLFISLSVFALNHSETTLTKKIVATYTEFTDNGQFMFMDADKNKLLFDEVDGDVEIDLYDDANVGKKFTITWEEEEVDAYDDEGEPTGDKQIYRRILTLVEVE